MRTIEVIMEGKMVTVGGIPDDAKITYGGLRPDQPGGKTNTLRIYKGSGTAANQLAVFRDVVSFHDTSLTITDGGTPKKEWL